MIRANNNPNKNRLKPGKDDGDDQLKIICMKSKYS